MSISAPSPRRGMPDVQLGEEEFKRRFLSQYADPAFRPLQGELDRVAQVAWEAYDGGRKSPPTRKTGAVHADPAARTMLEAVQARRAGRLVSAGDALKPPRQK